MPAEQGEFHTLQGLSKTSSSTGLVKGKFQTKYWTRQSDECMEGIQK